MRMWSNLAGPCCGDGSEALSWMTRDSVGVCHISRADKPVQNFRMVFNTLTSLPFEKIEQRFTGWNSRKKAAAEKDEGPKEHCGLFDFK